MAVTGDTLIAGVLDLVEMENATGTSGFAVTARVKHTINQGLSKLYYTLADGDNDWFVAAATITVTAGTSAYALPNGTLYSSAPQFYKLSHLYRSYNDKSFPLEKAQLTEQVGWPTSGPQTSGTVVMGYIPVFTPISEAGDWSALTVSTQFPPGWDDYVECFAARRLAIRDEQYERAAELGRERDAALAHVLAHVSPRDISRPDRVQDVTGRWQGVDTSPPDKWLYRLSGDYLVISSPGVVGV
jgi:hypothetical protein